MYDDRDPRLICPSLAPYRQYCFGDAGRVIGDLYCTGVVEGLIIPVEDFEEGVAEALRSIGEGDREWDPPFPRRGLESGYWRGWRCNQ